MRIIKIVFQGAIDTHFATAKLTNGNTQIEVNILKSENPNGRIHHVNASCDDDIRSIAECLQSELDGIQGTGAEVNRYYRELKNMTY